MNARAARGLWTVGFLAVGLLGCQRKDNKILGTPTPVSDIEMKVRGVDNHHPPDVGVLFQPQTSLGTPITDLNVTHFAILENGDPVIPKSYGPAPNYPFSVMLVIDHSGSMSTTDGGGGLTRLEAAQAAATTFLGALAPSDEAALIQFDDSVNLMVDFTTNKSAVAAAVNTIELGGATATYDAIVEGAQKMTRGSGLRLLIFLTDGDDTASTNTPESVKTKLAAVGLVVCGVLIGDGISPENTAIYDTIAQDTGGDLLTGTTTAELTTALDTILASPLFDNMYILTFRRKTTSPNIRIYVNYGAVGGFVDLQNFR